MGEITFAKVDGPPADWRGLRVIDLDTGLELDGVVECDTVERYVIRNRKDERGLPYEDPEKPGHVAMERITGRFEIRRPD